MNKHSNREETVSYGALSTLISCVSDIVLYISSDLHIVEYNVAAEKVLGYPREMVVGKEYSKLYDLCKSKKIELPLFSDYKKNASQNDCFVMECDYNEARIFWRIQKLGDQIEGGLLIGQVNQNYRQKCLEEDDLAFLARQVKEITGQSSDKYKTIKDYVRNIRAYYEKIISCMPNNVYWLDRNCITLGCNDNVLKFVGLKTQKEFIGIDYETMGQLAHWEKGVAESFKQDDFQVMKTGTPILGKEELPIKDENGNVLYYLSSRVPLHDDAGEVIGVVGISVDITDRKRAEELYIKHEAAQKAIDFTNLMAGSIAHELRTPLAGIKVNVENIRNINFDKIPPQMISESLKQVCGAVLKTIDATNHVINDMLLKIRTFATGGVPQRSFEELSITADIENLLEVFPFENNAQELVNVSCKTRFKYLGDRVLTAHVLGNLLKNALHAIVEADKGEITIESKTEGDFNLIIFRDTASGIPAEFVPKIFDQFETKKTTHGGTGLGLAFCKMVMDYYRGSITCNSKEGEYTEFVLSFPKIKVSVV